MSTTIESPLRTTERQASAKSEAQTPAKPKFKLSLDTWAVLLSLAAAALIRAGIIHRVPW
jgi:hypothetical protein